MEAKFFSEIEKKMDVKTIKDFEKEVRTKINNEFDSLRKKEYSWLQIKSDKKKKLYRLIDIYSKFVDIVDSVKDLNTKVESVKDLNTKVESVKQLKDSPVDSD